MILSHGDNDNENVLKELQTKENGFSRISILLIHREIISVFYKSKRRLQCHFQTSLAILQILSAFQYQHIMTFALQNALHTRVCTDSVDSKEL